MTPVRSLAEVQALDAGKLNTAAPQPGLPRVRHQVRRFAPLLGVPEDPATGSANGALGAYLVHHRAVEMAEPTTYIVSEQGTEIDRPSTLYIEVDSMGETISTVRVGGQVVAVAEGKMWL
jgi:trans-2,3-dihydro-3-hydroxyanthranilate isomerase